jgi:hypothetical protein
LRSLERRKLAREQLLFQVSSDESESYGVIVSKFGEEIATTHGTYKVCGRRNELLGQIRRMVRQIKARSDYNDILK